MEVFLVLTFVLFVVTATPPAARIVGDVEAGQYRTPLSL
jgi:hypothetical protein